MILQILWLVPNLHLLGIYVSQKYPDPRVFLSQPSKAQQLPEIGKDTLSLHDSAEIMVYTLNLHETPISSGREYSEPMIFRSGVSKAQWLPEVAKDTFSLHDSGELMIVPQFACNTYLHWLRIS